MDVVDRTRAFMERIGSWVKQINSIGSVLVLWIEKVKGWVEEEKKAMMASDTELEGLKKFRNLLIKILERSKGPKPEAQIGGEDEEEEVEEMIIRRRWKGKMVVDVEEDEPAPEADATSIFLEAINTHVPISLLPFIFEDQPRRQDELEDVQIIEEMKITPETIEFVPVEIGHISEGSFN